MKNFSFYEEDSFYQGLDFAHQDDEDEKADEYDYLDLIEDLYN